MISTKISFSYTLSDGALSWDDASLLHDCRIIEHAIKLRRRGRAWGGERKIVLAKERWASLRHRRSGIHHARSYISWRMIRFCPKSRKYFIDGRTWATATLTATLTASATATATSARTHHDTAATECFLLDHKMWMRLMYSAFGGWRR